MDAYDWLKNFLSAGPVETSVIRKAGRQAGFTRGDLHEAKRVLGAITTNNAGHHHRENPATKWYWSLPEDQA